MSGYNHDGQNSTAVMNPIYQVASLLTQIPVLAVVLTATLAWFGVLQQQDMLWIIVTLLLLSLVPLLYGAFVYKTKRISNADITKRKERVIPFFIITLTYGVYLLVVLLLHAPEIFKTLALHYFILALLLSVVTVWWKASVHTAGITQFVILLMLLVSSQALFLSPLIVLVGWMRIRMKSHTIGQVIGGIIVAIAGTLAAASLTAS